MLFLGGRAFEDLIYKDEKFSIESAMALERTSNLLLRNASLLNLNKDLEDERGFTAFHPDYSKTTEKVKINIEQNTQNMINQLYEFDKKIINSHLKQAKRLKKILLDKEVFTKKDLKTCLNLNKD